MGSRMFWVEGLWVYGRAGFRVYGFRDVQGFGLMGSGSLEFGVFEGSSTGHRNGESHLHSDSNRQTMRLGFRALVFSVFEWRFRSSGFRVLAFSKLRATVQSVNSEMLNS